MAWVARLNCPSAPPRFRPPIIARTAPSGDITTTAVWAFDPGLTFSSNTVRTASSAARCTLGSNVVSTSTSSVVLRVRKSGPDDMTQSANAPPARAAAAEDSAAGRASAFASCCRVRYP